jgi:hypothetical protein
VTGGVAVGGVPGGVAVGGVPGLGATGAVVGVGVQLQHLACVRSPDQHALPSVPLPVKQQDSHVNGGEKQSASLVQPPDGEAGSMGVMVGTGVQLQQLSAVIDLPSQHGFPFVPFPVKQHESQVMGAAKHIEFLAQAFGSGAGVVAGSAVVGGRVGGKNPSERQ